MFIPCPHCGFLVALIQPSPATGADGAVPHCPRCDGALRIEPGPLAAIDGDGAGEFGAGVAPGDPTAGPDADRVDADAPGASEAPDPDTGLAGSNVDPANAATAATDATPRSAASSGRARRAPSFVPGNTPAMKSRVTWPWYAASVALALVLALQLLLAQRHELAASARWRPWVEGLCGTLPCEIPPWREPQAFTMLERSVQPSPAMPGVLAVQASFRNDARWPQPWPTLVLSLSDVEGRQVGLRAFAPAEYRAGSAAADLLAPGQSATVRLQVREPASRSVAFTFDFQ